MPWTPVGKDGSSSLRIQGQMVYLDKRTMDPTQPWLSPNITLDVLHDAPFNLQPGMLYYSNFRGWNGARLSTSATVPFFIKRPDDTLLRNMSSGIYQLKASASRRSLDISGAVMFVQLPSGGIGGDTVLSAFPLNNFDVQSPYTFADGTMLDTLDRSRYFVNASGYIHDPRDSRSSSRDNVTFTGLTFALSPLSASGNLTIGPLTVGATLQLQWDTSEVSPVWMYWDATPALWRSVATTCGSGYKNQIIRVDSRTVNISALVSGYIFPFYSRFPLMHCRCVTRIIVCRPLAPTPPRLVRSAIAWPSLARSVSFHSPTTAISTRSAPQLTGQAGGHGVLPSLPLQLAIGAFATAPAPMLLTV